MWSSRNRPLVDADSSQMTGRMTKYNADTTPQDSFATSRGFCMAMRLGVSSPSTRVKYDKIMVMTMTARVSKAFTGMA